MFQISSKKQKLVQSFFSKKRPEWVLGSEVDISSLSMNLQNKTFHIQF